MGIIPNFVTKIVTDFGHERATFSNTYFGILILFCYAYAQFH